MNGQQFFLNLLLKLVKPFFHKKSNRSLASININMVLILWPPTDLGTLFSSKIYFHTLKQLFPDSELQLIVPPRFTKKINTKEIKHLLELGEKDSVENNGMLKVSFRNFDLTLLPSVKSFSVITHFISILSQSNMRIGVSAIDESLNLFSFMFDEKIELSWNNNPDIHISEIMISQLKNLDHSTNQTLPNLFPDNKRALNNHKKIILINNEPEDKKHRWSIESMLIFISKILQEVDAHIYFIEDEMEPEVKSILENDVPILQFISKYRLGDVMNILPTCDLVVTCNSDIMHLAGLFNIPQISIYGLGNAFNSAPIGENKVFIQKKSNLIDDVTAYEVLKLAEKFLEVDLNEAQTSSN